jgi:hypothetical protein
MTAQQLAQGRVVTPHDGGRGLTVEGAKQGQAPGGGLSSRLELSGFPSARRVIITHAGSNDPGLGMLAMSVAVDPARESSESTEAVPGVSLAEVEW